MKDAHSYPSIGEFKTAMGLSVGFLVHAGPRSRLQSWKIQESHGSLHWVSGACRAQKQIAELEAEIEALEEELEKAAAAAKEAADARAAAEELSAEVTLLKEQVGLPPGILYAYSCRYP